jgi:hypothetical protein
MPREAKGGACDERIVLRAGTATPERISHRSSEQVPARAAAPPCRTADCIERAATRLPPGGERTPFRLVIEAARRQPARPNRQFSGRHAFDVRCQDMRCQDRVRTPVEPAT